MDVRPQTTQSAIQQSPRRWLALLSLVPAVLAVGLDGTILSVALPTLGTALDASTGQLQWFVTSYALAFAAAMIPAGMLGDRWGRKRVLLSALLVVLRAFSVSRNFLSRLTGARPAPAPRDRTRFSPALLARFSGLLLPGFVNLRTAAPLSVPTARGDPGYNCRPEDAQKPLPTGRAERPMRSKRELGPPWLCERCSMPSSSGPPRLGEPRWSRPPTST